MQDPRLEQLADLLVSYSVEVQPKDRVLIVGYGSEGYPLLKEVYRQCVEKGAYPRYEIREGELGRIFFEAANEDQLKKEIEPYYYEEARATDVLIQIIADRNSRELAQIDQQKILARRQIGKELSDIYHEKRWILFEYPNSLGAYNAGMSLDAWEDFVFQACLVDWDQAQKEQEVLRGILSSASEVRISAEKTDLLVNIKSQPWVLCHGKRNMPDGEVFTSPHRSGVEGTIHFNTPTSYLGQEFQWIELTFKDGKVVKEKSDNLEALTKILETDEGSRYLGEFAFGTNRQIQSPVKSILFDEKIGGSNHMALGKCYDEAPNGNDSAIHWDLILRHKQAKGEVFLDGELFQKEGRWMHPELKSFNVKG